MSTDISVSNEQIVEKSAILFAQFSKTLQLEVPAGMTDNQHMICQEMLFYACEHNITSSMGSLDQDEVIGLNGFAEELYMVAFIFYGNTDERIIPFHLLDNPVILAYKNMALQICKWYKEGALPLYEKNLPSQST